MYNFVDTLIIGLLLTVVITLTLILDIGGFAIVVEQKYVQGVPKKTVT